MLFLLIFNLLDRLVPVQQAANLERVLPYRGLGKLFQLLIAALSMFTILHLYHISLFVEVLSSYEGLSATFPGYYFARLRQLWYHLRGLFFDWWGLDCTLHFSLMFQDVHAFE